MSIPVFTHIGESAISFMKKFCNPSSNSLRLASIALESKRASAPRKLNAFAVMFFKTLNPCPTTLPIFFIMSNAFTARASAPFLNA